MRYVSANVVGTLLSALCNSDMKLQDWLGLGLQRYQIWTYYLGLTWSICIIISSKFQCLHLFHLQGTEYSWVTSDCYWHWWNQTLCVSIWRWSVQVATAGTTTATILLLVLLCHKLWQPHFNICHPNSPARCQMLRSGLLLSIGFWSTCSSHDRCSQ
jgi:hypothetical protein